MKIIKITFQDSNNDVCEYGTIVDPHEIEMFFNENKFLSIDNNIKEDYLINYKNYTYFVTGISLNSINGNIEVVLEVVLN